MCAYVTRDATRRDGRRARACAPVAPPVDVGRGMKVFSQPFLRLHRAGSRLPLVRLDRMGCGASAPTAVGAASTAASGRGASTAGAGAGASCFIGPEFAPLKLANVVDYNHDTKIFEFDLPEGQSLNLPVCACILLKGKSADGEDAVRPYTPISDNTMLGRFQLLIKTYEQGVVSRYVHGLSIGDEVEFKHIPFNVKIQHPFQAQVEGGGPVRTVTMLCGGTGIVRPSAPPRPTPK